MCKHLQEEKIKKAEFYKKVSTSDLTDHMSINGVITEAPDVRHMPKHLKSSEKKSLMF